MSEPQPVALVTGGAVRVGHAITTALAEAGYAVWIHHHDSVSQARALASTLPSVLGTPRADLQDGDARAKLLTTVLDPEGPAAGRLDLLVNNAASFEHGAFVDRSDDDLRRVLELLLVAPLSLTRGAHAALAARSGCVINIGDLLGRQPSPGLVDHATAKAALEAATAGLALELAPVRVCAVVCGTTVWPAAVAPADRAAVAAKTALGRIADPSDVAQTVLFLARNRSVTGCSVVVDAGQALGAGRRPGRG